MDEQENLKREMTLGLRTTDPPWAPTTASRVPVESEPLVQIQYESQSPAGPDAHRYLRHPGEIALRGIPVMCGRCGARRDWLITNYRRDVWIRCRCRHQWLEPEITRAEFDAMAALPDHTAYVTVEQALADLGFDGSFAGVYLE